MIIISTLDNIFLKRVVAVFIISAIFAVFAGKCHFLSLLLLQKLLLAADLIIAIPSFIILLSRILQNFNVSNIALFLRSVQLPTKPFQPNNLYIYIQCSLQQDSPDSFGRLVLIYFLFPELRQTLELKLSRLPHQLCGIHSPTFKISKKYSFISP